MARYLYSELSSLIQARRNSAQNMSKNPDASNSKHWFDLHTETIKSLVKQHMPTGSGFDSGTTLDLGASHAEKLVFHTSYHHMHESGMYDGWTEHTVTVTPSLSNEFNLRIGGRNRNDIKDVIHEEFDVALRTDVTYDLYLDRFPQFQITSKWENADGTPSQCYQAWYVDGQAFWNDYLGARAYACELMENALNAR